MYIDAVVIPLPLTLALKAIDENATNHLYDLDFGPFLDDIREKLGEFIPFFKDFDYGKGSGNLARMSTGDILEEIFTTDFLLEVLKRTVVDGALTIMSTIFDTVTEYLNRFKGCVDGLDASSILNIDNALDSLRCVADTILKLADMFQLGSTCSGNLMAEEALLMKKCPPRKPLDGDHDADKRASNFSFDQRKLLRYFENELQKANANLLESEKYKSTLKEVRQRLKSLDREIYKASCAATHREDSYLHHLLLNDSNPFSSQWDLPQFLKSDPLVQLLTEDHGNSSTFAENIRALLSTVLDDSVPETPPEKPTSSDKTTDDNSDELFALLEQKPETGDLLSVISKTAKQSQRALERVNDLASHSSLSGGVMYEGEITNQSQHDVRGSLMQSDDDVLLSCGLTHIETFDVRFPVIDLSLFDKIYPLTCELAIVALAVTPIFALIPLYVF